MASYTAPISHATADDLAVTDWNAVANNTVFLYQKPACNFYNSVATPCTNNTLTQITLGGTAVNVYGFSVSSNNVILPLTGTYNVTGTVWMAGASGFLDCLISLNGSTVLQGRNTLTSSFVSVSASGIISATSGSTIGLFTTQASGGTVSTANGQNFTNISIEFIGSQ